MSTEEDRGIGPSAGPRTYSCTFGIYNQTSPWTDVRSLLWDDLTALLTQHSVGPKEGTCLVPAVFSGTKRAKAEARQIDVVFLDSDAGYTLEEISQRVAARGWTAVISSSHSHLATTTKAKRGNWNKYRSAAEDDEDLPERYLTEVKGYLSRVAVGASVASETDEFTFFKHEPCPKFRLAIPLLRPWLATSYTDQREANAAWKERIEALAASLRLAHDQACTDTSRLFYLPRHPADRLPETALLGGKPCDIFALPRVEPQKRTRSSTGGKAKISKETIEYEDPATGEVIDLKNWVVSNGRRFQISAALSVRRPDLFVPRPAEQPKRHIRCVNEEAHTQAGVDAATFIVNASESITQSGFVYHCRHAHCDGRDRLLFLKQMLEQGWLTIADLTAPEFLAGPGEVRALIQFVGGEIASIVDKAEIALVTASLGIYQRGAFVVRPGMVSVSIANGREVRAQRILELGDHALVEALTIAADWEKWDARSETMVRIDAPIKIAMTYKQRVGRWRLPVLTGLINAPTLRDDGSVLSANGYDPTTGLLMNNGGLTFPPIPDNPTRDDAAAALALLSALIVGFSFVNRADKSVALSAILTACIRKSLPTAPLHGFTAPVMGSGKSMLVDIATMIASGRAASVIAQGKTEEELEKRLGALLLAGEAVIAIDNCESSLGGEFLCQMLTQQIVRPRILGKSETPEMPANAMVTATGNNLALIGDMARRSLLCRLDPQCERPELRSFSADPVKQVEADRGKYLIAALTVLRAYHVASRPKQAEPLGSFDAWSRWVRDALIWLGEADPIETMEVVRSHDPKLDALIAVLTQWWDVIGSKRVGVQDVIEQATQMHTPPGVNFYVKPIFTRPSFREALLQIAGDAGVINGRRLSRWIGANENRIVENLRIVRKGMLRGFMTWEMQSLEAEETGAA